MPERLDEAEILRRTKERPEWAYWQGALKREFRFADFATAMVFVNRVAKIAEQANHHPDIDIRWNKVTLLLATHSKGGVTDLDFKLAAEIDAL